MPSTVEQLRRDIDSGLTGDKVAVLDPAAAPLGADEEAAGTPLPPEAITQAHQYELARGRDVAAKKASNKYKSVWLYVAVTLLVLIAVYTARAFGG